MHERNERKEKNVKRAMMKSTKLVKAKSVEDPWTINGVDRSVKGRAKRRGKHRR